MEILTFRVKGIELYSETEAKITLHGIRNSVAFVYVPVEEVGEYVLNQLFSLSLREEKGNEQED